MEVEDDDEEEEDDEDEEEEDEEEEEDRVKDKAREERKKEEGEERPKTTDLNTEVQDMEEGVRGAAILFLSIRRLDGSVTFVHKSVKVCLWADKVISTKLKNPIETNAVYAQSGTSPCIKDLWISRVICTMCYSGHPRKPVKDKLEIW